MNNKFDKFLLGTLWLILSTLGACFWFDIQFGFNVFSGAHWQHLAYMQATQTQIRPLFYASIIISLFCILFGLYLLVRPRFRKIQMPQQKSDNTQNEQKPVTTPDTDIFALARPRRLNGISAPPQSATPEIEIMTAPVAGAAPVNNTGNAPIFAPPTQPEQDFSELHEIFTAAGYIVTKSPRVKGYKIPVMAIGNDETVWIGGVNIETSTMQSIIDSFQQIFSDTLEDVEITTNGFVINASDAANPTAPSILTFADNDELRAYIAQHPNPPTDPDMAENFEAFSGYISTVIDYIGRL